ncbi:hypothetical protein COU58_03880 [Candidatus Pacearchaeota archaeon CG10_big_fil_rev_8_21_14_0_10_32_42]|nr:MAG: hypothetical protein COU58_03880 [Candidatus Pacearchaeota archaeon CG10_big_fil_rev_8_21_14_0_10_32_42]
MSLNKVMKKRGLSPVIATVLLIAIVIIIALIVFMWLRGMTQEAITKFDGKNVQLVCDEVNFEAEYTAGNIYISNLGTVPIYRFKAKVSGDGAHSTSVVGEGDSRWPEGGLSQGERYTGILSTTNAESILLIPVLIGKTQSEDRKAYTCEERQGKEIYIA